jgi:hypothetical protein
LRRLSVSQHGRFDESRFSESTVLGNFKRQVLYSL